MPSRRRLARALTALVAAVLGAASVLVSVPAPPARAFGADDTIMGPSRVPAAVMAAWFRSHTSSPYAVSMPIEQLADLYVTEGSLAGVRGDIAFAQSILETRWFSFPAGGLLTVAQNNFAGIGACDSCATGMTFASVQLGVRAQMQQLRRYADPNSRSWNIGATPVQPLWPTAAAYDVMNRTHGWAPTWQSLTGTWATAPSYAATIDQLYNSMWAYAGRPGLLRWQAWELPGGLTRSTSLVSGGIGEGPAVASWQPGRLDVFATNTSGTLLHKWWDTNAWSASWESLGSPPSGPLKGRPAAVSWGPNRVDVFARGADDQLWTRAWDGSHWTGWGTLGGVLSASPAAAAPGANQLDVIVNGSDQQAWHMTWSGTGWSVWAPLGGVLVGNPAAISPAPGRVDLFVRGSDDRLYQRTETGPDWAPWRGLGGVLSSGPTVASWASNRMDIFVRGSDGALWTLDWDGVWHFYSSLGGVLTSDPAAVAWGPTRIDVFVRGNDNQLWHRWGF
jgi:hypothetical protein